ncbi:MAG: hypothetical protein Q9M91_06295 [Candidatus Dojkabacteria bacterium]|nr:hypothetical protein [Candidatus Dojkabacteria bacterium]
MSAIDILTDEKVDQVRQISQDKTISKYLRMHKVFREVLIDLVPSNYRDEDLPERTLGFIISRKLGIRIPPMDTEEKGKKKGRKLEELEVILIIGAMAN